VEVILAILIISAIITVLLYFYQRSSEVRAKVLEETEFLSVSRMFLEQITSELRSARVVEDQFIGFEGSSNLISFIRTSMPRMDRWIVSTNDPVVLPPSTDLERVTYTLLSGTNEFDPKGIDRTQELLTSALAAATNMGDMMPAGTNSFAADTAAALDTNAASMYAPIADTNLFPTNDLLFVRPPLTDRIRYLRFRYWAGTNWVDTWSGMQLPAGVEITLGRDAMPEQRFSSDSSTASSMTSTNMADDYPYTIYRRVVYLPNSRPAGNGGTIGDGSSATNQDSFGEPAFDGAAPVNSSQAPEIP
jgi:type II secretory pathway pseudopilin PulG